MFYVNQAEFQHKVRLVALPGASTQDTLERLIDHLKPPRQTATDDASGNLDGAPNGKSVTASEVYNQVADAIDGITYEPDDQAAFRALNIATAHLGEIQARQPTPEDTETCRLAALAAITL